ncbi:MAG TPA: hypothetical protein VLC71_08380 [Thermomonas sp.]|nr:hypothetical protein [Thermomonas sp.]
MLTWIRRWISALALLCLLIVGAWWAMQQTTSYARLEALIRQHPVVADEVGKVSSIRLPWFGYGLDVTDGRMDPNFRVQVIGSKGEATVRAEFIDGTIADAYLLTAGGHAIPLVLQR